jgi:putative addiction module component (TIGR02574 family)
MNKRARAILREALALPSDDRAHLAAELVASLEEVPIEDAASMQAEWALEIERRARRVLSGVSNGESWDTVRERTARKLAGQSTT